MSYMRDWRKKRLDSFSPARDLPSLLAHFKSTSLTGANGSGIRRWLDLSPYSADALQLTTAQQGTVKSGGLNGRPTAVFASGQYVATQAIGSPMGPATVVAQPLTFIVLFKASSSVNPADRPIVGSVGSNVALTISGGPIAISATTAGASGGPDLNDDQWHIGIGIVDTDRGFVFVDGDLVAVATTQTHGANSLTGLSIGGVLNTRSFIGEIAEVILLGTRLPLNRVAEVTAAIAADWGLPTPRTSYASPVQAVTDSGGQAVSVFVPRTIGTTMPLAIFNHNQGGSNAIAPGGALFPLVSVLVNAGWVVAVSNNHGADSWSNNNAETDVANARAWVDANIAPISKTIMVGYSMGACLSVIAAKDVKLPDLKGVYMIDPAVNLQWLYANGFSTSINTAFGIASAGAIPAGKDPATLTGAQLPAGLRWRATASTADTTVAKASNIDLLTPIIAASSPAENTYVAHAAGHLSNRASLPADLAAFATRCV